MQRVMKAHLEALFEGCNAASSSLLQSLGTLRRLMKVFFF